MMLMTAYAGSLFNDQGRRCTRTNSKYEDNDWKRRIFYCPVSLLVLMVRGGVGGGGSEISHLMDSAMDLRACVEKSKHISFVLYDELFLHCRCIGDALCARARRNDGEASSDTVAQVQEKICPDTRTRPHGTEVSR